MTEFPNYRKTFTSLSSEILIRNYFLQTTDQFLHQVLIWKKQRKLFEKLISSKHGVC